MRHGAIIGIVAALGISTASARATTVGIVRPQRPAPVTAEALLRVLGEVRSLGLQPEVLDEPEGGADGAAPDRLARLAAERHVDAVIAFTGAPAPSAVEVWASDGKGRAVARRVPLDPAVGAAPQATAIRAIELLRSCLLELNLVAAAPSHAPPAPPAPPPPSAETTAVSAAPAHRFAVGAGAGVLVGLDGVGTSVLPSLRLAFALGPKWLLQADVTAEGTRGTVTGAAGNARVAQDQAVLGVAYRPSPAWRLRPLFSLGAGALRTSVEGQALSPNQSQRLARWAFLLDAAGGAALRLGPRLDLTAAAHLQAALPYPAVRFLGQTVATAARPNVLLALTLEVWL